MKITIGHTHDADDALMFYAMFNNKVDCRGLEFEDVLEPITVLNSKAVEGVYDMTALSVAYLPKVANRYAVLPSGSCMSKQRGPMLILNKGVNGKNIAVPGFNTTAFLAVSVYDKSFNCTEVSFDKIYQSVMTKEYSGGVLINEDQLLVDPELLEIVDLGKWWFDTFAKPLPLGIDVVRKTLPEDVKQDIAAVFKDSIKYALNNIDEAMDYAVKFARGMNREKSKTFATTFVNKEFTLDMGQTGTDALNFFLKHCLNKKLVNITFI